MVGKQGFIRTLEAVIAILLVLGFILYILPRKTVLAETTIPEGVESARNYILTEFLTNKEIRDCIGEVPIKQFFGSSEGLKCEESICWDVIKPLFLKHIVPGFNSTCEICDGVAPCTSLPLKTMEKSIYPGSIFMYFKENNVKYVRVYFWRE